MRPRRALKWSLVAQFVARAGSFLLGLALARLLSPTEFGTYTVALGLFTLLLTVDDLGVLKGLVRWPGEFSEIAPTARTLATISSAAMYAAAFLLAPFIARAAGTPGATTIMRVLCVGILLDAVLQVVPGAALQRQMRQDLWVIVEGVRLVTNAAVTIPLAATGSGVWALVIGALTAQAMGVLATCILGRVPFNFGYDRVKARELLRTSLPYSMAAFLGAALLIVDYLVIGHLLGPAAVGIYLIAFNVSSWPITLVGAAVRAVAVPGLSKIHHAGGDTGPVLRRGLTLLLAAGAPFVALLIAAPYAVIGALYGSEWAPGGVALRFLAIMAIVRLLDGLIEDALFATARSSWILGKNALWLVLLLAALPVGAHLDGIRGVGIAQALVAAVVILPLGIWQVVRAGLWNGRTLPVPWRVVLAAAAAATIGAIVEARVDLPPWPQAILVGLVVIAVYAAAMFTDRRRFLDLE